jgi:Rrf2 family protein
MNCRFAFAVHVLSVLALHPDEVYSSERLSETVNTNAVVIRRLLLDLREAGLIDTQRGPGGGAKLRLHPTEINLSQIHQAVVGPARPFGEHPNEPDQACKVGREIKRVLEDVATRAANAVCREYETITLADIIQQMESPTPEFRFGKFRVES